jgi:hypothetical protein
MIAFDRLQLRARSVPAVPVLSIPLIGLPARIFAAIMIAFLVCGVILTSRSTKRPTKNH